MTSMVSERLRENYDFYYDDKVSEWRRLGALDKAANIVRLCSNYPHRSILEVGCGEGAIMQRLIDIGFSVDINGLEISDSALSMLNHRGLSGKKFDGYHIPMSQEHVDLSILSHVLEHLEFPRKLIYQLRRVSDFIFIEVPLEDNELMSNDYRPDKVGHINFYSRLTIRRLLQTCDLQVLSEHISNLSAPVYHYRLGKLKGMLAYGIKEMMLSCWPSVATRVGTYHYSALCRASLGS